MKNIQTITHLLATVVVAVAGSLLRCEAKADHPEPVKKMLAAWRARQDAVQSGEIHWKDKVTDTNVSEIGEPETSGKPAPTTTVTYSRSLTFFGDRYLYHRHGQRWSPSLARLVDEDGSFLICRDDPRTLFRGAFDTKVVNGRRVASTFPLGYLDKLEDGLSGLSVLEIRPVINWMRPFSLPSAQLDQSQWRVEATDAQIEDSTCIVVVCRKPSGIDQRFWVDPSQDYSIRRATLTKTDVAWCAYDAWYKRDHTGVIVPMRWRMSTYAEDGTPQRFYDCTIARVSINTLSSAEQLNLDFPPGTLLSDQREGRAYLLGSGGQKRTLTPGELRRGYDAIAAPPSTFLGSVWAYFVIGAIILFVAIAFAVRRRYLNVNG